MSARRVCACGANLEESGDALVCVGCGARARTWRVFLDGMAVAASATRERGPHGAKGAVAFTSRFEAQLIELRDGPPQPLLFAIPSSWRRGRRKRRLARR